MFNRKEYMKQYRKDNQYKIKQLSQIWYQKNKEKILEKQKNRHKENQQIWRGKNSIYSRNYYKKNKEEVKKRKKKYMKLRRHADISFKLICNLRTRLWGVLKLHKKSNSIKKLIGCSVKELKQYLENQFKIGMTWENYGKWHVDHIIPCCSFDLSKEREQRKCFNYANLRPLWAEENRSKGGKNDKFLSKIRESRCKYD